MNVKKKFSRENLTKNNLQYPKQKQKKKEENEPAIELVILRHAFKKKEKRTTVNNI